MTQAPATETQGDEVEAPTSMSDIIAAAMKRNWDAPKHVAFTKWMERESNGEYHMDMATIVACQALYQVFRKTEEFEAVKAEVAASVGTKAPKAEALPTTPEEAAAQLAKDEKRQKSLEAQAKRLAERAAMVRELQAKMAAANAAPDAGTATAPEPEADDEPGF